MDFFVTTITSGLVSGAVVALVAVGIVMVFTATHAINLAHGEVITLGMYASLIGLTHLHWSIWIVLALMPFIGAAIGIAMEAIAFRPFIARAGGQGALLTIFITTLALSLGIQGGLTLVADTAGTGVESPFAVTSWNLGPIHIAPFEVLTLVIGIVVIGGVWLVVTRTQLGRAMRAIAQNADAAALLGANPRQISSIAWAASGALGAIVGALLVLPGAVLTPFSGAPYLFIAFTGAVLGGFGSIGGAVVGCLFLSIAQQLFAGYVSGQWASLVPFAILIIVLAIRPQGLFGRNVQRV
jgi:branched-chain amino acid transport system permease protein